MQLSVERYAAESVHRGANLDRIDTPLNNRLWLMKQFGLIRKLDTEPARLARLREITHWSDPGPGGFYDDLGDPLHQPHLGAEALDGSPIRTLITRRWFALKIVRSGAPPCQSPGGARSAHSSTNRFECVLHWALIPMPTTGAQEQPYPPSGSGSQTRLMAKRHLRDSSISPSRSRAARVRHSASGHRVRKP